MFWRRKGEGSSSVPAPSRPPASPSALPAIPVRSVDSDLEAALEGAAEILRARARYAFSTGDETSESVASTLERWASHLLVRSPPPGRTNDNPTVRDWRGLIAFANGRAKKEQQFAQGYVRDMREAIFALAESFSRTSYAQGKQEQVLRRRLASLNVAVETGSLEGLKREALGVAAAVTEVLEQQQRQAHEQTSELRERLTALGEELEETRREGETDPLTRLANRRVFDTTLARSLTIGSVMDRPVGLLMVDVDHFKSVNDTHGHPVGDQVLRALADALTRAFPRRADLVARYGGEEFAVVLSDTPLDGARALADRLLKVVRALEIPVNGRPLKVTISAGIAVAELGETAADLTRRADQALYAAKRGGRNRFVEAGPSGALTDAA
jgi:diguanylate cyclase (GGDEF)-like protein